MSFRSWRERMLLSQERVAGMSGLSLRTVQRLEAGHRVSYASLRALATAFKTDVDVLERELYAVTQSTEEFVEIPRWVRLMADRFWFGGPRLGRRDAIVIEVMCIVFAVIALAVPFLVEVSGRPAAQLRVVAILPLMACYLTAVSIRTFDKYKLWPGAENAAKETPRTWRSTAAEYTFFVALGLLSVVVVFWLVD